MRVCWRWSWELGVGGLMAGLSFSAVSESEQERVFATLVLAFAADPVERWLYPEPQQYLLHFPRFLAAFGGRALAQRSVWEVCAVHAETPDALEEAAVFVGEPQLVAGGAEGEPLFGPQPWAPPPAPAVM
jgi:hypothetical protein